MAAVKLLAFPPKGFTVKELEAISGISEKTVRRDLLLLSTLGSTCGNHEDFGRKAMACSPISEYRARKGQHGRKI